MERTTPRLSAFVAAALFFAWTPAARAFEEPPVTTADAVLGAQAKGRNYRVEPEVRGDGLMH
ncbi:MAG: hypothetical protein ACOYOJ_01035, partial [Alsobacter sp.]